MTNPFLFAGNMERFNRMKEMQLADVFFKRGNFITSLKFSHFIEKFSSAMIPSVV